MLLKGIDAFKQQAENAKSYFEKKGDQLRFEGISIFRFTGDKIIELTDIF